MDFWEALFMGLLQGLTEFLPVSSSGHLYLASQLLGLQADSAYFIYLHVGTLIAVLWVYRKVIVNMLKNPKDYRWRFIVFASLPTFALAAAYKLLLPDGVEFYLLPFGFALTALLLNLSRNKKVRSGYIRPKLRSSLIVGLAQGFAVIPGLSRSGTTVSAMGFLGFNREQAAELSFLISIPVILGGAAFETLQLLTSDVQGVSLHPLTILCGVGVAAISGIFAIKLLKKALISNKTHLFAFYLAIPFLLSILCLI